MSDFQKQGQDMYCKIKDLYNSCQERIVQSWCVDNAQTDTEQIVEERLSFGIQKASDTMNLYLTKVLSFPINPIPSQLVNICVAISLYYLLSRKGYVKGSTANDVIADNYKDAMKQLEQIAVGKLDVILGDSSGDGTEGGTSSSSSSVASYFPKSKITALRNGFEGCGRW